MKNKLDQGYYAIKRIELNPKNKQLNKKIIREVKLLSKLNHENVVRYYNSWIESDIITDISETDSSNTTSAVTNIPKVIQRKEVSKILFKMILFKMTFCCSLRLKTTLNC